MWCQGKWNLCREKLRTCESQRARRWSVAHRDISRISYSYTDDSSKYSGRVQARTQVCQQYISGDDLPMVPWTIRLDNNMLALSFTLVFQGAKPAVISD
eukprot:6467196-Amphidinium_carterae.1